MLNDPIKFIGSYKLEIFENEEARLKGIAKETMCIPNKVTNASLAAISGLIGNTGSQTAFTYIALGTSTTAVLASHTTLQAEIVDHGLSRVAATVSRTTTTQTNDTLQLIGNWTVSGSATFPTIEEMGIFNASSSGVMLSRVLTTTKSTTSGNAIQVTYTIQVVGN